MPNMTKRISWFFAVGLALPGCDFSSSKGDDNVGSLPSGGSKGDDNEGGSGESGGSAGSGGSVGSTATGGTPGIMAGQGGSVMQGGSGGTTTNPGGSGGTKPATGGSGGTATGGTAGQGNAGYPAGPYGFAIGSTVADAEFKDGNGKVVKLSELRAKPGVKVIVWSSGAEWCSICRIQAPKLEALHKTHTPDGLLVFESLHESSDRSPATAETVSRWLADLKVTYPVYVEKSPNYAGHNDNPLELIIDAATMKIRYRQQHTSSDLDAQIKSALSQAGK
jgi:thiol-disulfide isomerase/thioredoxin